MPIAMVNQIGGNDQLVFDGSSFVVGSDGEVRARAASFQEDLLFYDTDDEAGDIHEQSQSECDAVYDALVLGTRDYVRKCDFQSVIIGLSGGMDSSLTAAIAVDALGVENVLGVGMPGPYSSEGSVNDSKQMADALDIRFEIISINDAYLTMMNALAPAFGDREPDTAEENLQARLRGDTLMALSNKFGSMVLTTGNKSELAVGYCTLYGDMAGGLAVISDVPKTLVYKLARVANQRHAGAIPESVFTKPPSAELRPDQKDSDSLPEYDVLDPILRLYVEQYAEPCAIAKQLGLSEDVVRDVTRKVERNEYKRQQAAPGLRVTSKAFGMGRRFPIAQRYSP
jgi:NAD+ synthase/NAD+ synthase (glutamine-hydrolysing)